MAKIPSNNKQGIMLLRYFCQVLPFITLIKVSSNLRAVFGQCDRETTIASLPFVSSTTCYSLLAIRLPIANPLPFPNHQSPDPRRYRYSSAGTGVCDARSYSGFELDEVQQEVCETGDRARKTKKLIADGFLLQLRLVALKPQWQESASFLPQFNSSVQISPCRHRQHLAGKVPLAKQEFSCLCSYAAQDEVNINCSTGSIWRSLCEFLKI